MPFPLFKGAGTALVTPFTSVGVDYPALEKLIEFQIENAADAIIVCGTTGEASTMSYDERNAVIDFSVKTARGRVPIIAGSGSNNTENAVKLSKGAQDAGADALLVVTPFYNKATQKGLIKHYTKIADCVDIPIILYNVPSRTGVSISAKTYQTLAKHPKIIGTKEASGNIQLISETLASCGEFFYVWSGNDSEILPLMALGAVGAISVAANIVPYEIHRLCRACQRNDYAEARILNNKLLPLSSALFCEVNPIPIKTAMNLMNMNAGYLRLPLCEMETQNFELLQRAMSDYGILS